MPTPSQATSAAALGHFASRPVRVAASTPASIIVRCRITPEAVTSARWPLSFATRKRLGRFTTSPGSFPPGEAPARGSVGPQAG
jgi:hypothetical protein